MKIINNYILTIIAIITLGFASCVDESVIPVETQFKVSNNLITDSLHAFAGTPINIVRQGTAEFISLYTGKPGSVFGEVGALGIDFDVADSLSVTYNADGVYKLSLISTSSAKFGANVIRNVKSAFVKVIDIRNSFKQFIVTVPELGVANQYVSGIISNDSIIIKLPDVITNFKFKPAYLLDSDSATVRVNDVLQKTTITENNFNPSLGSVKYSIKADYGNVKDYFVQVKLVPSSNDKKLIKFEFGANGNGEKGVIDQVNKTVTIKALAGTILTGVGLSLTTDVFSTVQIGRDVAGVITYSAFSNRPPYFNMSNTGLKQVKTIKVIAQNKTEAVYSIIVTN